MAGAPSVVIDDDVDDTPAIVHLYVAMPGRVSLACIYSRFHNEATGGELNHILLVRQATAKAFGD